MEFDKKTISAFVLIGLILIFVNTDFYKKMVFGDQNETISNMPENYSDEPIIDSSTSLSVSADSSSTAGITKADTAKPKILFEKKNENEREIIVDTPSYYGVFSSLGGSLKEWRIKKYHDEEGQPVVAVKDGIGNLSVKVPFQGDTLQTDQLNFKCSDSRIRLNENETHDLVFELELLNRKKIQKIYHLSGSGYVVGLTINFQNLRDVVDGYYYSLVWSSGLESTEKNVSLDMSKAKAYSFIADDVEDLDVGDDPFVERVENDKNISWAGIRTKYFALAIIPRTEMARGVRLAGHTENIPGVDTKFKKYQLDLSIPFSRKDAVSNKFDIYLGPLEYDRVKSLGANVERMMDLGWPIIRELSVVVVWALTAIHKVIPNYGIVIILFSILVKVILHPLTKKSYQSMGQMQALQPKMTEIREKHGKDPQKMNAEMMKLYKEYGVNPLGGCLPMVLQMPLLFALFRVFESTIEFRQAPFFGWITDLSAPDTIYMLPFSIPFYGDSVNVLPLVMCATMFIQQKMTVTDPKQKAMVYFMPVMFAFIFNSFPSGLNLYYTLFNLFSILQQKFVTKKPATLEKKKTTKTKSWNQIRKGGLNAALSRKRLIKK